MLVADQPDDLPLPPAPSNVNGGSKVKCTEAGEERRAASAAVSSTQHLWKKTQNKY